MGNPVRAGIAALPQPAERFAQHDGPLRLLVLGGSQGALALNRTVPAALALLPQSLRPVVRHQTGERTLEIAENAYAEYSIAAQMVAFIEDMAEAYAWADLVVCRAGALTVAELSAAGLPAIFIPYPSAVDDHQTANARLLKDAGAAEIMTEEDLTPHSLAALLSDWLSSRDRLCQRAQTARAQARPEALARITDLCLELAGASA